METEEVFNRILDSIGNEKFISLNQIINLLPEDFPPDKLEELLDFLENNGIEVVIEKDFSTDFKTKSYYKQARLDYDDVYIDTPEKFYFFELSSLKSKRTSHLDKLYIEKLKSLLQDIKTKLYENRYFVSFLKNNHSEKFNYSTIQDFKNFIENLKDEKALKDSNISQIIKEINKFEKEYIKIREELIIRNLPLVLKAVKLYSDREVSKQDLIQEGNLGLIEGVDTFDPSKDKNFTLHLLKWIRKRIKEGIIKEKKNISVSRRLIEDIKRFIKISKKLREKYRRNPLLSEITEELGWDKLKTIEIIQLLKKTVSLDSPAGDERSTLKDYIPDESFSPYNKVFLSSIREELLNLIKFLPDKEQKVIKERYGFNQTGETKSYEEIAEELNLDIEKVKLLEKRGLRRLKEMGKVINIDEFIKNSD